jgi:bacterioferritin-associated ferredoxin
MNENCPNPKEPPICYCTGTTEAKIKALMANEINTLEAIAYETGATTGCGACEHDIQVLIAQHDKKD